MSYFYSFQSWLYHTSIYQNLLRELPAPLNNIYFDSILCICLVLYLIYRLVETVHIIRYRKKIRRKQESDRKRRLEKDQELHERERKVDEKEERIGRFFDSMESLFTGKMRTQEAAGVCRPQKNRKSLGRKMFFLEKKGTVTGEKPDVEETVSDYDVVMGAFASEVEQEERMNQLREKEERQLRTNLKTLDASLRSGEPDCVVGEFSEEKTYDKQLEKRKSRARREEERERKREEKRLKRGNKGK